MAWCLIKHKNTFSFTFILTLLFDIYNALKVMPPILLCGAMTSEADAGGMAVEVELFRQ
jgi:hypothetical protein